MWKLVYGSVRGTSHAYSEQPCQDYCAARAEGTTLVAACSDGAGSADLSHVGSKAAVERFLGEIGSVQSAPTKEQFTAWIEAARSRVIEEAAAHETTPRQLACTFLAAVIGDDWAAFVQIGDGFIVFDGPDGYEIAFWPENGEYANTTVFLTDDDYTQHLQIRIIARTLTEVALLTDGLQRLAIDFAAAKAYGRFFAPLFKTVRNSPGETLRTSLVDFMDSKRVNDRTDDDKTLVLATRTVADAPPTLPDSTP